MAKFSWKRSNEAELENESCNLANKGKESSETLSLRPITPQSSSAQIVHAIRRYVYLLPDLRRLEGRKDGVQRNPYGPDMFVGKPLFRGPRWRKRLTSRKLGKDY